MRASTTYLPHTLTLTTVCSYSIPVHLKVCTHTYEDTITQRKLDEQLRNMDSVAENPLSAGENIPAAVTPASMSRSPSGTLYRKEWSFPTWIPTSFGRGIIRDLKARAPYYASDWTDAWNYRVVPAIVLIFFAKLVHIALFSM